MISVTVCAGTVVSMTVVRRDGENFTRVKFANGVEVRLPWAHAMAAAEHLLEGGDMVISQEDE